MEKSQNNKNSYASTKNFISIDFVFLLMPFEKKKN